MHKFRRGALIAVIALMIGGGLARWRDTHPLSVVATSAATAAVTAAPPTPTREVEAHSTPRPVVVTAIRTAEPSVIMLVDADGLNLRDKPAGHVVGSVLRDTELKVTIAGKWALVTEGVHKGRFVAARYLRAVK